MPAVDPRRYFYSRAPLAYRLSEGFQYHNWQWLLTRLARHRQCADKREWYPIVLHDPYRLEVAFVAPRIPLRLNFTIRGPFPQRPVKLELWLDNEWRPAPVDHFWSSNSNTTSLVVMLNRMVVVQRLRLEFEEKEPDHEAFLEVRVGKYAYKDTYFVGLALGALEAQDTLAAEESLNECLALVPNHFRAADMLARLRLDGGDYVGAQRWALCATVASDGRWGRDVISAALAAGASDLAADVKRLRESAREWELEKHYGAVCLLYEQHYWLGFDHLHMVRRRKIVDIRRKAAARLLHTIRFRFSPHNEMLQFARLRILGIDGTVQEVPKEQLAFIDSPEHDASILTEEWKEAVFNLPELESGDALELEYVVLHANRFVHEGRPDFFIKADMIPEFPVWESSVQVACPHTWDVRCITINGGPPPEHVNGEGEWQSYRTTAHGLAYDSWATESEERGLRSPHVCCSWGWKSWEEFGHDRREFYVNLPVDEVPDALKAVMDKGDSSQERLCLAFEWIRDRLKYASLPSAKKRIGKSGTAAQIVAAGVGDCVDRAYLVNLVAKSLDLKSEYLLAVARSAPLVANVPAEQFDHVLIRVRNGDGWVYLDGTSSQTPFGQPPWELQGASVLGLGPNIGLIEVPVDDPAINRLSIAESLVCDDQGGIAGAFSISAAGILGRIMDRRWKGSSMSFEDPDRAAKLVLSENLSTATLTGWSFRTDPMVRDSFELTGNHRRDRFEEVGNKRFGVLEWHFQAGIPYTSWKERIWKDVALFPLTLTLTLRLDFQPPPGWRVEGHSRITPFEDDFAAVLEDERWEGPVLRLTRQLIVKRRRVFGADVARVPEFLHALESTQKLSVMLSRT